jgi:FKBP-type peptidyl-prolyl cis-trans isomerase
MTTAESSVHYVHHLLHDEGIVQASEGIQILDDKAGFGQHAVQQGDLVLVHYTGKPRAST